MRSKLVFSKTEELIPGGLASGRKPEDFDPEQLKKGIKVELEHSGDAPLAQEIAMDHLVEDPEYYTKLEKMEKSGHVLNDDNLVKFKDVFTALRTHVDLMENALENYRQWDKTVFLETLESDVMDMKDTLNHLGELTRQTILEDEASKHQG